MENKYLYFLLNKKFKYLFIFINPKKNCSVLLLSIYFYAMKIDNLWILIAYSIFIELIRIKFAQENKVDAN